MKILEGYSINDPQLNLAVEEYLLRHVLEDEPILLFYVNDPSIIVGRNQNVFEEINFGFVHQQGIPVLRRLSGGGTVYHDPGNLNFSLLAPDQRLLNDYETFTRPVVRALQKIGLTAELHNRSSLFVSDKKVSGNAQYATGGRLLSHGTLLWDCDLDRLRQAIKPPRQDVRSRAVQSVRSSVANAHDLSGFGFDLDHVIEIILGEFLDGRAAAPLRLDDGDLQAIKRIADERYFKWAWNIGRSPKFSTTRRLETEFGEIALEILVEQGHIQAIMPVENDPMLDHSMLVVCDCLQGLRYEYDEIVAALQRSSVQQMPPGLKLRQLTALLF